MYVVPDGACGWVLDGKERGGSVSGHNFTHTAFLPDGALVVAGSAHPELLFAGTDLADPRSVVDFGLGPVRKRGGNEVFVVMVDRAGKLRWFHRVVNLGEWDEVFALRVDGTEVIVGSELTFYEVYSVGYVSAASHGLAVLMAFDGTSGEPTWSRDLEQPTIHDNDEVTSIARAADKSLRVAVSGDMLIVQPVVPK